MVLSYVVIVFFLSQFCSFVFPKEFFCFTKVTRFIDIKLFVTCPYSFLMSIRDWKDKLQIGRIYLQFIYLIKNFYPEHVKNSELNNKKTIQFKNGKIFQRCFTKEDLHVKPMKSCLTLVDIRDMQIKAVMGCHYPSVRMVRIFKRPLPNVIMDVEQLKFSTLLGKNVNNTGPWGKSLAAKES